MVDWMQGRGWTLPERVFVQQYVRSRVVAETAPTRSADAECGEPTADAGGIDEIVFFGRLETRKGIELFCDALDRLADEDATARARVTFMGKQTHDRRAVGEAVAREARGANGRGDGACSTTSPSPRRSPTCAATRASAWP